MKPGRLPILARLAIALLIIGVFSGCASSLKNQFPPLENKIKLAKERGAKWCAPKDLASAEAYLDFAKEASSHRKVADAKTYLANAESSASAALERSAGCLHDLDGDGVPDMSDGDPYRAEDYDGWEDEDGIPDYDNDGDGFLDKEDACPDSPEDVDNHDDIDGCPDIDNDLDGVPDRLDKCQDIKEDLDGFDDNDGCPDPDNDKDGIPDEQDKCPDAPETINNFFDDDGCPDIPPTHFKLIIPPEVRFTAKTTKLSENDKKALREFAVQLISNPELSLRIEAHVEPGANKDKELALTQKQADVVRDLLIAAGIEPERLIAIGFGGNRPIPDAKPTDNRRVLLMIYRVK